MGEFHTYRFEDVPVRYEGKEVYATGEAELYCELELPDPDSGITTMDVDWEVSSMGLELLDEEGDQILLTGDAAIDCLGVYRQVYQYMRDNDNDVVDRVLADVAWS
jgi:hypothetical protein